MVDKKKRKKCFVCKEFVDLKKDHYVLIGTYNRSVHKDQEDYFHFNCFCEWFNKRVIEKSEQQLQFMQEKVLTLINNPLIKSLLKQVQGSDALISVASTNLKKKSNVEKVKKKINNDRSKKRGNSKRRSKA